MIFNETNTSSHWRVRISDGLIRHVLPLGWLALLTGLFWIWERPLYPKLYYALIAAPTLIALLLQPALLKGLLRNPLIATALLFTSYTALTLAWSDTDNSHASLGKRPIYVLMLFMGAGFLAIKYSHKLFATLKFAAVIATLCSLISLAHYLYTHHEVLRHTRFTGYGALYNPLLSAHIYGFFAALWLAIWLTGRHPLSPLPVLSLLILGMLILSTGSRTPLMALAVTLLWLGAAHPNRRSLTAIAVAVGFAVGLWLLYPEALTQRGLSQRPEIWQQSLQIASEKPWFGHGYDHQLVIRIASSEFSFYDPHNIELAVLLSGGLFGLALWLALYATALIYAWRNRHDVFVLVASALLVFGFSAGLTEGRDFLSRPKEHWFLIWIPLALLAAAWLSRTVQDEERHASLEVPGKKPA